MLENNKHIEYWPTPAINILLLGFILTQYNCVILEKLYTTII